MDTKADFDKYILIGLSLDVLFKWPIAFIQADYILQKIFSRHCIIGNYIFQIWAEFLISQTVTTNKYNDTKSERNGKTDSKDNQEDGCTTNA